MYDVFGHDPGNSRRSQELIDGHLDRTTDMRSWRLLYSELSQSSAYWSLETEHPSPQLTR